MVRSCPALVLVGLLTFGWLLGDDLQGQQSSVPAVLISRQLAEAETIHVGDTIRFSARQSGEHPHEFRVTGIYEPTPDPMELNASRYKARLHLPDLLDVTAAPNDPMGHDTIDSINIDLTDEGDAEAFSRDVMARVPSITAQPTRLAARDATFVVLQQFHLAIAIVTILASTVFLLALSVMLVDERREIVGMLRLIGLTARRVLLQVLVEGVLIAIGGAIFGLALALASQGLINRYFQWHYDTALIFVRITPRIWLECVLIAVPLGILASVAASWGLLRQRVLSLARR